MEQKKFRPPLSGDALAQLKEQFTKEQAQYEVLKQNFEGLKAQREAEFAKELDSLLSDEERDIVEVGGNAAETYAILKAKEEAFVTDFVQKEKEVLEEVENELHEKQGQLELLHIESQFAEENPDVDFEGLVDFVTNGLNNNELNELHKLSEGDQAKFIRLASEKFHGATKPNDEKSEGDDELPTDLSDVAGATGNIDEDDTGSDEDDSEYLSKIGLR